MVENNSKPDILAIIVTFNRPQKLRTAIEAALSQVEPCHILVVDNASGSETKRLLDTLEKTHSDRISSIRLPKNIGGAGGFYSGIKEGYSRGYWGYWLMDDDCVVSSPSLDVLLTTYRRILQISGDAPGFVCSNVRWIDGSYARMNSPAPAVDWLSAAYEDCNAVSVRSCSFVSVLVPREIVAKVGLPLKEYFIWFDDTEYTSRITKIARGFLCLDSVVVHDMERNEGAEASITQETVWKFKYRLRNEGSHYWHTQGKGRYLRYFRRSFAKILMADVSASAKYELIAALLKGPQFKPTPESV